MRTKLLVASLLAACGSQSPAPESPGAAQPQTNTVMHQVWDVGHATDGTCQATPACMEPKRGVACTERAGEGVVQITETPCVANAKTWRIGQRSSDGTCSIVEVNCEDGQSCDQSQRNAKCPKPIDEVVRADDPPASEPQSEDVEYSVSAQKNVEKGQAALAAHQLDHAQKYFAFAISRFPYSRFAHDAELGLVDVEVARADVIVDDTTYGYCVFIEHHPFHPAVVNGDVACRVQTAQKRPCDRTKTWAAQCPVPTYCTSPAGESRPECRR